MPHTINHLFFNRPADTVAMELLGCMLCVKRQGKVERYRIIETEAYMGPHDLACHAAKGKTKRTEIMYRSPGTIYVYLIYGMYHMLNFVTGEEGYPAAVLIRGIEGYQGPGKLTRTLGITRVVNGCVLGKKTGLWVEFPIEKLHMKIQRTPRIGVTYAKNWADKKLRFVIHYTS